MGNMFFNPYIQRRGEKYFTSLKIVVQINNCAKTILKALNEDRFTTIGFLNEQNSLHL